ncbi:MAG: ABC transporter substrate-binding protein, partial [Candidatus Latescibacteria bacterium]|nr:ABC transporter substrate-binding protein [Candidatus Latescibacterota bacterium]
MKRFIGLTLISILLLSSLSGGFCFPIKAKDDLGREIKSLKPPQRIVSLAPTNTEILFVLELGQNVVGVTDYCNYPEGAKRKEKIGGFANPNIDKIVALKSDLILAFGTLQKPIVQELENKEQKVFWIYPHTVKEVLASFERIGEITGKVLAARKLREDVEKRIQDVEQKLGDIPEDKRPTVFRVMGIDPPGTVGGNSFQTDIYRIAGGRNVFADV